MPFPGLSSLSDRVLSKGTLPRWVECLITSLVSAAQFPGCTKRALSQVCCVSLLGSWSLTVILLVDVNHPGSQEDLVSNWEPAHSLVEDAISGAEIAPHLLALALTHLPLGHQQGEGLVHSCLALLWYSFSPLFFEWTKLCLRAFPGKVFFFFFPLSLSLSFFFFFFLSGYPTVWAAISR